MLTAKGFKQVYNLKGGLAAWQGHSVAGPAEMGMMLLQGNESPTEVISLAYGLEEELRKFYTVSAKRIAEQEVSAILLNLAEIEITHKKRLFDLYLTFDSSPPDMETFESNIISELMEGGFNPEKLLEESLPALTTVPTVLNFAMMLEAQGMDLYMRYADKSDNRQAKEILFKMADEEKTHLNRLGELLEKFN